MKRVCICMNWSDIMWKSPIDVFGLCVYIILITIQFRPCDDSFGRLKLCNLSHTTEYIRTIVSSKMNDHMIRCLPVSPHGEFAPTEFAPTSTHLAIKYFKFIFLIPRKKRQYCAYDETKHVYFSFFNLLNVTEELEIESLGWVHGGELAMGQNWYTPMIRTFSLHCHAIRK